MRHWRPNPPKLLRRALAAAAAAGFALFGLRCAVALASTAIDHPFGRTLSNAVLGQTATFESPFANAPVNANTRHTRERVDRDNPYSRKKRAIPFEPFEIPAQRAGVPESTFEIFELPRAVAKLRTARLDPENPFQRARAVQPLTVQQLENPFAHGKNDHAFDYEQPLPSPKRSPGGSVRLEPWSK